MKRNKLKVKMFVKGKLSPFVHGRICEIKGEFAHLDNGGVYPLASLRKATKKETELLPDFAQWTKASMSGLGIFQ